jgi:DNA-binding MarR family transcriptional regulator
LARANKAQALVGNADYGHQMRRYLTFRISRIQAKLNAQATRILREASGTTLTQWRVIALLATSGPTRLSDIARETVHDKGLLSRNLKVLIKNGVVNAQRDTGDHRAQILSLTPKGQAIFDRTLPVTQARQQKLQEDLSDDELAVFHRVLDKLEISVQKK